MRRCVGFALFGISILPLGGQDKTTQPIISRAEPTDRKLLPGEIEIRSDGKRLSALIQSLATEEGKKSGIPIFAAMAAAIGELSSGCDQESRDDPAKILHDRLRQEGMDHNVSHHG